MKQIYKIWKILQLIAMMAISCKTINNQEYKIEIPNPASRHLCFANEGDEHNLSARLTLIYESINYYDYLMGCTDWDVDDFINFMNIEAPVIIPIDDIAIVSETDIYNLAGLYRAVVVIGQSDSMYVKKIHNIDGQEITETEISRGFYANLAGTFHDLRPLYCLRAISTMNLLSQSICEKLGEGIIDSSFPELGNYGYFPINNTYKSVIDGMDIECNDRYVSWTMFEQDRSIRYKVNIRDRFTSILGNSVRDMNEDQISALLNSAEMP